MILNLRPDACQCCCVVVVGEEELERGEQPRAARRRALRAVILGRRRQRHGEESHQAGREHSTYRLAIQLHRVIQVMRRAGISVRHGRTDPTAPPYASQPEPEE